MSEDHLRDVLLADELCHDFGNVLALEPHNLCPKVFRKMKVGLQRMLPLRIAVIDPGIDVQDEQFAVDRLRHARSPRDQVLRRRIGADTDGDPLSYIQIAAGRFRIEIRFQAAIHHLRHVAQGDFAQGNQITGTEEVPQRAVHALHGIDIAPAHALLQRLGRNVRQHNFIHTLQHPVGYRLAHHHAGYLVHHGRDTFEMLNVHGGNHVDVVVEQLENILVPLVVLAAFDVGVRQFVHQRDLWMARENGIHVHLFKQCALVVDLLARNRFQPRKKFLGRFAAVCFNDADHYVFAAALAADGLAQHGVSLADAGRISQKQLENTALLHRSGLFQPLLGGFLHAHLFCGSGVEKSIRYNHRVNPRQIEDGHPGRHSFALSPQRLKAALSHYAVAMGTIAIVVILYRRLPDVNPTTVALTFLLVVLLVASKWGLTIAITTAVVATLAFNYYFLPPIGTFTIADPQNWIALLAFLISAIVASRLSERARRETLNATRRRKEVERLYSLSQQLLATENVMGLLNSIPQYVCDAFSLTAAAMYLPKRKEVYRTGVDHPELDEEQLESVSGRGELVVDEDKQLCFVPLRIGVRPVGSLGLEGAVLSRETLEAVGSLIAISIERAGAVETLTRTEATRESEKLRSALLDSVTHEFRTPLTAIKLSVTTLLSTPEIEPDGRKDLLTVINEETDRLNRLVGEAAEMAQLDAQQVELRRVLYPVRVVVVQVPEQLPPVRIDLERIAEVLVQLLENAAKYSPAGTPITIGAEATGKTVCLSVADRGPGIDDMEQSLIFEKFYRGRDQRYRVQGTGMGLAIAKAIVEAHGGTIGVTSQLGSGSVFHFTIPV